MRCVRLHAPRDLRVETAPEPVAGPRQALVRVHSVGICGSDLHYYEEGRIGSNKMTGPLILGHEFAGTIEGVGEGVDPARIGQRVAVEPGTPCFVCEHCRRGEYNVCPKMAFPGGPGHDGALCDFMAVPAEFCFPVPETMDHDEAAAIEPLAVALHSVELAGMRPGDTVAVLGLGPIGLLIAMAARVSGAVTIFGSDLLPYRVAAGAGCGVDHAYDASGEDAVDAILRATGGRGVDVAFDAARSSDTAALACRVARPGGTCVLTGISGAVEDPIPVEAARRKGLTVRWCRRFRHNYPRAIALVSAGQIDVKKIVSHSFPLERAPEAFALVSRAGDKALKVSIDF